MLYMLLLSMYIHNVMHAAAVNIIQGSVVGVQCILIMLCMLLLSVPHILLLSVYTHNVM